jgi:competence protein ComEA
LAEQVERYRWLIVALFSVPLVAGIVFLVDKRGDEDEPLVISQSSQPLTDLRVYVTGAVMNPGVYPVAENSRWADAVVTAGGFAEDANPEAINLARRVEDEDHIVVPRVGETAVAGAGQNPLVNINTASESELMSLPGIGEVRARGIVLSRTQTGLFGTTDDLLTRELIPDSIYEDIVALITVSQ